MLLALFGAVAGYVHLRAALDRRRVRRDRIALFSEAPRGVYSWSIQLSSHGIFESDPRGPVTESEFIDAMRRFPWSAEVARSHRLRRSSPTLTIIHPDHDRYMAIAGVGDPDDPTDLAFLVFWAAGSTAEDPRFQDAPDLHSVEHFVRLFFSGSIPRLDESFASDGMPLEVAYATD